MRRLFLFIIILYSSTLLLFYSKASAQTPPRDPRAEGFTPLYYVTARNDPDDPSYCPPGSLANPEFHPLRPYPASPCDSLIPQKDPEAPDPDAPDHKYLTFSCANSLNTHGTYTVLGVVPSNLIGSSFDPCTAELEDSFGSTMAFNNYYRCGGDVCLVHRIDYHTNIGLENSKFPIIGNTQNNSFDDAFKVNQYVNWYLSGTVQNSDQLELDPDSAEDMTRLTTYAGPVKKLLSETSQAQLYEALQSNPPVTDQLHNYFTLPGNRLLNTPDELDKYSPFSSQEDITGESNISFIPSLDFQPESSDGDIIMSCPGRNPALVIDNANALSDSRLYFPGLRSSNALTDLIHSINLPHPPTPTPALFPEEPGLVDQEINDHQGIDDPTVVIREDYLKSNLPTRNTEVIPGALAPNALFTPDPPTCELLETRTNSGDNLIGSSIGSTLTYYHAFRYHPSTYFDEFLMPCEFENRGCSPTDHKCCWGECEGYSSGECTGPGSCPERNEATCLEIDFCTWKGEKMGKCPAWPRQEIVSDTRISVFMKTPLVERIYDTLVVGEDALLRRFLPKKPDYLGPETEYLTGETDIENTLPGEDLAQYSGSTSDLNSPRVDAGSGHPYAEIYFDRIGSLADHFLGGAAYYSNLNFQRLWRPHDLIDYYAPPPGAGKGINCNVNRPDQSTCIDKANYIEVANRWYGLPTQGHPYAAECFNDTVYHANQAGIKSELALLIWINESDTSNYEKIGNVADFGMYYSARNDWTAQITAFLSHVKAIQSMCVAEAATYGWPRVFAAMFSENDNENNCIPSPDTDEYLNNLIAIPWNAIKTGCDDAFPFP